MAASDDQDPEERKYASFKRRVLFVLFVVGITAILILMREIILLAFVAVLFGMIFRAIAGLVGRTTGLGPKVSLLIAILLILVVVVGTGVLMAPMVANQLPLLAERINEALMQAQEQFGIKLPSSGADILKSLGGFSSQMLSGVVTALGLVASVVSATVLVVVAGVFFAAEPMTYRNGIILMFPIEHHGQVRRVLRKVGDTLLIWLRAQAVTMLVVGVLTWIGTWAIGLPSPMALGAFAALGEFIPMVGPAIAAIPALLVAFGEGGSTVIWTLVVYTIVQQLEGNVIMPLVQRGMLAVPPAILLFALIAMGIFFGPLGIIVAAPLTVALYVAVREFYVRDHLGQGDLLDREEPAEAAAP